MKSGKSIVLEKTEVSGRPATVAYLMNDFSVAKDKNTAELIKVVFDDDRSTVWLKGPGKTGG